MLGEDLANQRDGGFVSFNKVLEGAALSAAVLGGGVDWVCVVLKEEGDDLDGAFVGTIVGYPLE